MIGSTILHYKILEKLGEGGMGVVYKAQDTKLERTVAIKLLPAHLLTSKDDRARFNREAKAAAALNHPNIATVYEINEYEGKPFIVMEYVEGKTLNNALEKELFKLKDAVSIAIQVAEGLKAAHAKGIVHRDIKSSNVLLSNDGQAKILDFGLAKTAMSTKLTKMGITLGTVAYMSPEQVSTPSVDHRTDLWSLGVVIFEMLTGRFPFSGEYDQAIFYSILNEPPEPLTAIRSGIPMSLEWIVNKLLAKNPDERYQNANDLIIDLKAVDLKATGMPTTSRTIDSTPTGKPTTQRQEKPSPRKTYNLTLITIAFIVGVLLTAFIFWKASSSPVKLVRKYQWPNEYDYFAISPDGLKIAYSQGEKLYIRQLDKLERIEIKNEQRVYGLVWSPKSDQIAYFAEEKSDDRQLRKVAVDGSGNVLITNTKENYYPRYWGVDDSIVVTTWDALSNNTLLKVSASGGELKPMYNGDSSFAMITGNLTHVQELPDNKTLLLSRNNYQSRKFEILIQDNKKRSLLYEGPPESQIQKFCYDKRGFILYTRSSFSNENPEIWAIPVDLSWLSIPGEQFLVASNANRLSLSENGLLLYNKEYSASQGQQLVLLSRSGQIQKNISSPQREIYRPDVSKDGRYIATTSTEGGGYEIWRHDLKNNIKTQLTFDFNEAVVPSWSPDGKKIVFQNGLSQRASIDLIETNSLSEPKVLINSTDPDQDPHWSADGRYIFFTRVELENDSRRNIWYLELGEGNKPKRLFDSRFADNDPFMSPDGKYVAYASDKSGRNEIYVTNFPEADHYWQVSFKGGYCPKWVGDELFFINPASNTLVVSKIKTSTQFQSEAPQVLFSKPQNEMDLFSRASRYTVTPDGQNIVAVETFGAQDVHNVVLVENWLEEFKDKIQ